MGQTPARESSGPDALVRRGSKDEEMPVPVGAEGAAISACRYLYGGRIYSLLARSEEGFCPPSVVNPFLEARVVELVDTQVSEACALTACEFESRLGHHLIDKVLGKYRKLKN